jgi:hypothetical protein
MRPNGNSLVVGRRADTSADLLTNEDLLILQGGTYSVFGSSGNDAIFGGPLAGPGRGMPLQITADGGAILAATTDEFGTESFWLTKLNRTGGINVPMLTGVKGSSYANKDAASTERSSTPIDQPVTSTLFTSALTAESTDLTLGFWNGGN